MFCTNTLELKRSLNIVQTHLENVDVFNPYICNMQYLQMIVAEISEI